MCVCHSGIELRLAPPKEENQLNKMWKKRVLQKNCRANYFQDSFLFEVWLDALI
jgi:hypothetical protein